MIPRPITLDELPAVERRVEVKVCRLVHDNRGQVRVMVAATGEPLGELVPHQHAEQLRARRQRQLVAIALGLLALAVWSVAVWHHGRWFERQYGVGIHESRFSVG